MKLIDSQTQSAPVARRRASSRTSPDHRPKISSILVPVDFSTPSLKALDYAVQLAAVFQAKLTVLHILEVLPMPEFATYPVALDSARLEKSKEKLMAVARKHGCDQEVLQSVKVRSGVPFREITRAADSLKADMIVISTHGYTGFKHVLLGSTAERVVRYARCPVVVLPARS